MSLLFPALSNANPFQANTISGLQRWYMASQVSVESVNRITVVVDQSGNGRNATAATGSTARPTLSTTGANGQRTMIFDGVANYLDGGTNKDLIHTDPYTFAVVFEHDAYTGSANEFHQILNCRTESASFCKNLILTNNYSAYSFKETIVGIPGLASLVGASTSFVPNLYYSMVTDYVGSAPTSTLSYDIYKGASAQTLSVTTTWTTQDVNQYGRYPGNSGYFKGGIAEILIYNKKLNNNERQLLSTYLQRKYGT